MLMERKRKCYEYLTQIKKANRRYMTNCYLNRDVVCKGVELQADCGGIKPYAAYGKWVCEFPVLTGVSSRDNVRIREDDNGRLFMDSLNLYFDERSDLLPDAEEKGGILSWRKNL